MQAALLMIVAAFLFATMGVAVKLASALYGTGEIVFYRGLIGTLMIAAISRWRGVPLRTPVPAMHFWRSTSGVAALMLWFYAIGNLPLATAVTLNYMSSVWMALFLLGGAVLLGASRVDWRLLLAVMVGFAGVALILRPTMAQNQLWHGMAGVLSGMLAAMAYLQVTALGRAGEPELRVVLYFSLGSAIAGAVTAVFEGFHAHSWRGAMLLLATGLLATVAQLMMTRAYSIGRPLVNASLQYLGIVFSFFLGVWIFGDPVTWMALAGMALIVAAGIGASRLRSQAAPQSNRPTSES
ncbi:DMT family transporter [Aquabacterium humicola]|uniref:DMT family transporter n=1 Tax=Aquabacterium humicola TaxID=3237377 RepID=UPI0025426DA0|nr:DMT family transporter [Rubrivivax pictus]